MRFLIRIKKNKNKNENFRNELINKINKLNTEQKKGIFQIIYDNNKEENILQNKEMEIDINKLSFNKLKQLNKYLNDCIHLNKSANASMSCLLDEEKEYDILKNDDLSSCLSDDDEDDEE